MGLTNTAAGKLSISNYLYILRNPIYHGLMRFRGEYHEGKHPPLVTKELFDKVQAVMSAKSQPRRPHKTFKPYLYRQMFVCGGCGATMTTETQKGHNYLRCTRKLGPCSKPFVREEAVAEQISTAIKSVALEADTADWLAEKLRQEQSEYVHAVDSKIKEAREHVRQKASQVERLILALSDGTLSNEEFRVAKNRVVLEKRDWEEKAVQLEKNRTSWLEPAIRFVLAAKQAVFLPTQGDLTQQRDFFRKVGSNRKITNKQLVWEPRGGWKTLVPVDRFAHNTNAAPHGAAFDSGEPVQHGSMLGD